MAKLGIGFMAVTNAQSELGRGALVSVPLAPLPMIRTLGMIYRKDRPLSHAALGFIEVVIEFARRGTTALPEKKLAKTAPKTSRAL